MVFGGAWVDEGIGPYAKFWVIYGEGEGKV